MVLNSRFLFILLCLTTSLLSCKNKSTQFFLDYQQEVVLPPVNKNWVLVSQPFQTYCQIRFEKNDTKRSKVHTIYLKKVILLSDEKEIFNSLQLMNVKIACPSISREKITFKSINTILSDSSVQYQLLGSTQDVKEFIKHKQFEIELYFSGQKRTNSVKATLILEFLVEGELIKTILHQRMLV